ncbi:MULTISPECIES: uridine phosphorylase [Pseudoalteromonas]|jgi:uridine phosphorylase|uniref:uridine phosphorylase n=1 Tax=Pseudoalteromonas TaxID=53246 RepID=UPI00078379BE|nr:MULTISPECIES: uridine phosphorylase [Pseudoalteromonas]MCF7499624.1 uridine phosphorylase [Pseudoalteromonas sp. L1]RZF90410.1 uridine phosphorylase [Pseudoalteromonas sp. CO302Y]RZG06210.1 uridine phosphorylase [Pseudoalteromonas sp. CO133X]UJX27774.1 uridine phosphorylase [Pseudoalteromonas sp. CF6-2]MCF7518037.1 uridine phosphorylase [Pseudoalteromonas sp. L21]|tara:strand:- start:2011 stop:2766 length:756 start_codon:yes stop_codon:yes gene_type:complete
MEKVFHLGLTRDDLKGATLAIVPGDPDRSARISSLLDDPECLAKTREFHVYRGVLNGHNIVVCSTGIGGPSTSIAVEELAQLGINTFLRIGTTGAIQPHINEGDILISQASVRLDGASQHFAPLSYPAASDFFATQAMVNACNELGIQFHIGITASSDTFYPGQERYDTHSGYVPRAFQGSCEEWQKLGVMNYEMESATLFTMCAALGLRAACVAGVLVNRTKQEIPNVDHGEIERKSVAVVIEAAKQLLG